MALTLKPTAPALVHLDPAMLPRLREYIKDRKAKRDAARTVRERDKDITAIKVELAKLLGDSPAAICRDDSDTVTITITVKPGTVQPAAITLHSKEHILWEKVDYVAVGNRHVMPEEIKTIFGGRTEGPDFIPNGEI